MVKPAPSLPEKVVPEEPKKPSVPVMPEKAVPKKPEKPVEKTPAEKSPELKPLKVDDGITVSQFAGKIGITAVDLIKKLMGRGILATLNQRLDMKVVDQLAKEYGCAVQVSELYGEDLIAEKEEAPEGKLVLRPPVVTIMGHVDHGKTTLLDTIRESNVVATETGGITQHIGAYTVDLSTGRVTFLDTPGHAAFTAMRARGAKVTDIVILVVAADDGVQPQTIEAIDHAKEAGVPIVVAVNKIDKKDANPERVKQELNNLDLRPEEWGGKTIFVEVSALKGTGIKHLLEMLLLEAEMLELKANPEKKASGAVIEARLDKGRGPVATVLVQSGTLHINDAFVVGSFSGKIRAMNSDRGEKIESAYPSTPVEILGIEGVPRAGDKFQVVDDERLARQISLRRQELEREKSIAGARHVTLDNLYKEIEKGEIKELKIIIKGDVHGSVEVLAKSMEQLSNEKVKLRVIHSAVGEITESDVMLASASNAILIGFHVQAMSGIDKLAEQEDVEIRLYKIIYEAINDVKVAMAGLLAPKYKEVSLGRAEVRQVIKMSKSGAIAGSYVVEGKIIRGEPARIIRANQVIAETKIVSLKRFKDDVKEVASNYECGIGLGEGVEIKVGDVIQVFKLEKEAQEL